MIEYKQARAKRVWCTIETDDLKKQPRSVLKLRPSSSYGLARAPIHPFVSVRMGRLKQVEREDWFKAALLV